jgi:di/tricarboxylate transporter
MAGLVFLMVTGVLSPNDAFVGFSNQAVFTVGALFIVAAGIQKTRALSFLEKAVFDDKASLRTVLFRMMASTSAMSAFLNNTPIVAMLIPQIQEWADRTGHSASRLLIPLSYSAIVGGVVTLIGTSTNLIVSGMLTDRNYEPLGLFELSCIGLPAAIIVLIYFYLIGYKTLPGSKKRENIDDQNLNGYQFDFEIPKGSNLSGLTVEEAGLRALDQAFLIHVVRQNHTIGPVGPGFLLEENDILTFIGELKYIDELAIRKNLIRSAPVLDATAKELPVFEAVVAPTSFLVGKTFKEIEFRERFHGVVVGIQRRDEQIKGALGNIPVKAGDLLLIEAKAGFEDIYNNDKDNFYLVTGKGVRDFQSNEKAPIALAIMLIMIGVATFGLMPIVTAALVAAILIVLTGCIKKGQILGAVNIPILLVIASAIGVGQAIETTGIAQISASFIIGQTAGFGIVAVIISLYLITNLFTEVITNNAAAVLMVPVALAAALEVGLDSHAAAVTVAVAASASFLTPIGYQTNLMVMGAGGYKFNDYVKAGLPVTLIMLVVTVTMVMWKFV